MQASQFLFPRPVGPTISPPLVSKIEVWYDIKAKHWVIQALDLMEFVIGESEFAGNKNFALDLAADMAVVFNVGPMSIVLTTFHNVPVKRQPHPTELYRRVLSAKLRSNS